MNQPIRKKTILRSHGIAARWVIGSLIWTIAILLLGEIVIFYTVRDRYYSSVEQAMSYRLREMVSLLEESPNYHSVGRRDDAMELLGAFSESEKFEMMLLGRNGEVFSTSSGFAVDENYRVDDFMEAHSASDGFGSNIFRMMTGEKVITVCALLDGTNGGVAAIRLVSSLERVDAAIQTWVMNLVLVGMLVLFFSVYTGVYFLRSIVHPIRSIGATTRRIAEGDFAVRIDNRYNDEIGALCDNINEMAVGLSQTEQMKNEFISSVSHELRTPLTSIKGWGETLITLSPDDRATFRKGMEIIMKETDRLSDMVEDLLDFSRIECGNMSYEMAPLDLVAELTDAVITVEQRAARMGIEILYNEPETAAPVYADRTRLKQVFVNILDNAIKYSGEKRMVDVCAGTDDVNAYVTVTDYGRGIPEEELPLITNRFYKATNSLKGSGIGLSIVNEIVIAHGGVLKIESKLSDHTTVQIALPLIGSGERDTDNE